MKTKNIKKKKSNRMLMSELINLKIYKTNNKEYLNKNIESTSFLKQTFYNFKKILQIVFQYHFNRKKILIIGENLTLTNKKTLFAFKKTNHIFIPKEAWINGLLSNKKKLKKFLKKKNPLLKQLKKPRLIVFYNYWNLLDSERYKRRIVDITLLNHNLKSLYCQKGLNYSILGNLNAIKKKKLYNVFSRFLEKIFKTRKIHPSRFLKIPSYPKKKFYKNKKKFYKNKLPKLKKKNFESRLPKNKKKF